MNHKATDVIVLDEVTDEETLRELAATTGRPVVSLTAETSQQPDGQKEHE